MDTMAYIRPDIYTLVIGQVGAPSLPGQRWRARVARRHGASTAR